MTKRTITKDDMPAIIQLYKKAIKRHETSFKYKGNELLVDYVKYVIEYFQTYKVN